MPTTKVDVPSGPPRAQGECLLFNLPAEIRNSIYQLALAGKPDEHNEVAIRRFHMYPDQPTGLELLGTCRLIYQEAAGIFYSQYNIRIDTGQYDFTFDLPLYASQLRLKGLRSLRVTFINSNLELVSLACKRLRKLPALKTLVVTIKLGDVDYWGSAYRIASLKAEKSFLKRAVKGMESVSELRFDIEDGPASAYQAMLKKTLEEVAAMLPSSKGA